MNNTLHRKWFDDFVLELRLRDVPGDAIGDAAATVREFLADSGQAPEDAFGPAREYAASLELPRAADAARFGSTVARAAAGLLAFLVLNSTFAPLIDGRPLLYSLPQALLLAVPIVAVASLPAYFNAALRNRRVLAGVVVAVIAAGILSGLFTPRAADAAWLSMPAAAVAIVAGAVLLATSVWDTVRALRTAADPVVDPLSGPRAGRGATAMAVAAHWVLPAGALCFWLVALAAG